MVEPDSRYSCPCGTKITDAFSCTGPETTDPPPVSVTNSLAFPAMTPRTATFRAMTVSSGFPIELSRARTNNDLAARSVNDHPGGPLHVAADRDRAVGSMEFHGRAAVDVARDDDLLGREPGRIEGRPASYRPDP